MSRQNRRQFLKRTAVGSVAAATFGVVAPRAFGRVLGANGRLRVAVVGINQRGQEHIAAYAKMKDVEIAYLVDPDSRLYEMKSRWIQDHGGIAPKCVADLREVLQDKDLDAVSIASPNHSHALLAIWACQAGKDVYVEKPCCHNIFEGRKLVQASRKYGRIVQHGTQSRSDSHWQKHIEAVRSGKYGKLLVSYGWASKPRRSIGFRWAKQPPKGLNYDLWLGPAPQQPYHENLVHYNWHWFWDFGNGEIGNQGVHQMDIARWAMPDGAVPVSAISVGGRYGYQMQDQGQTPNTQLTVIDFGGPKIIFEDRGLVDAKTTKVTNEFHLEAGVIRDGKFYPKGKTNGEPLPGIAVEDAGRRVTLSGSMENAGGKVVHDPQQQHFLNFVDCVRSRKREDLAADIGEGFSSARLTHLANISYRLGREVSFRQPPEGLDAVETREAFESMKKHLADAGRVKLAGATYQLGRKLAFDAATNRFSGDEEANTLLSREYREPFVVPENV
ncbi:MAG: Gfo/Idh/MocA family oxidoreductase [Planctomycetaceae bacterium]|nr:Gfo/Idh/MocA family oxidoreductase [Planctomycetaceae bacterium]